jgi:hypothetical protein
MKLYADEDFGHRVTAKLRVLGHDVVSVMESGRRGASDEDQLAHATAEGRALVTFNRADFHALHRRGTVHAGIITCTRDADVDALAGRIHASIVARGRFAGEVVRIVRGAPAKRRG